MSATETTQTMDGPGLSAPRHALDGQAGLVLLYAPAHLGMAPAFPLRRPELFIGRDTRSDIVIAQRAVSRQHTRLHCDGSRWILSDLGGRNGTLLGGRRVEQARLNAGDEIRIGDVFFKYVERDIDAYSIQATGETSMSLVTGRLLAARGEELERIARCALSVLILGESGAGKEVLAKKLHQRSGRAGAFVALHCAAIPQNLFESELFGHRKGAFSGAIRDHHGLVRAADGGTLFLDELGDMPAEAQVKLLRVLQNKQVTALGATAPEPVDVRVMCATHRTLSEEVAEGRFRGDLYARINEYAITLPPLRRRKEDIYPLCRQMLSRQQRADLELAPRVMAALLAYDYPYNIRELNTFIKRGVTLAGDGPLELKHLPEEVLAQLRGYGDQAEQEQQLNAHASKAPTEQQLRSVLDRCAGNVAAVSRHFGKGRQQIHRWMSRYCIDPNDFR